VETAATFLLVLLAAFVVFHSIVLLGLVRFVNVLASDVRGTREPGGDDGNLAPLFESEDLTGQPFTSESLRGRLTALLFVSPTCPTCTTTLAETQALQHKANHNVVVICRGSRAECASLARDYGTEVSMIADTDDRIARLYRISSVPSAVLIGSDGRIRSVGSPIREDLESLSVGVTAT
jgi:methylamine dehydrogenase accessory protein MauD